MDDLRHTYATNAIRIGDPIKTVSENLGHSTVAFTLDEYGHVTPAMKQDSAERMQRLIDFCCLNTNMPEKEFSASLSFFFDGNHRNTITQTDNPSWIAGFAVCRSC